MINNVKTMVIASAVAIFSSSSSFASEDVSIAFMPDIHFHDVYANFTDGNFKGLKSKNGHEDATIRTMYAQLTSTRLFNENYFAMIAALEDMGQRNIKYVALPGDFSDDGQPVHMRGLIEILDEYHKKYGFEYFAAPGNHDPTRPFGKASGEGDFLGKNGITQPIYSIGAKDCKKDSGSSAQTKDGTLMICSEEVRELGYDEIVPMMGHMGFFPKKDYLYWSTPFSSYSVKDYDFDTAKAQSNLEDRQYEICKEGTGGDYKKENYTNCLMLPDTSYVVEPIKDIWLVAIDANVFVPKDELKENDSHSPDNYNSPSNAGYNKLVTHKENIMDWLKTLSAEAKKYNKQLIAFSHYPMVDFDERTAELMADVFGEGRMQLRRVPKEDVTKALADAGIRVHIGGHMHFNDTGVRYYDDGSFLVNIQAPSIAAYVPAYKILTLKSANEYHVETVVLEDVPRFDELFEHYHMEWDHLNNNNPKKLWNKDILQASNYREFTDWHLKELTRLRFLPRDWPCSLKYALLSLNAQQLLILSQISDQKQNAAIFEQIDQTALHNIDQENCNIYQDFDVKFDAANLKDKNKDAWAEASIKAKQKAAKNQIDFGDLSTWTGYDFAVDFYRIRNADSLALKDVDQNALRLYKFLATEIAENFNIAEGANLRENLSYGFAYIVSIFDAFLNAEPSDKFIVNLQTGKITELE